jgi:hypothetical protein
MNNNIKTLTEKMNKLRKDQWVQLNDLDGQLQAAWNEVFENDAGLNLSILRLENSREYGADDGGIYSWTRLSLDCEVDSDSLTYLENYLVDQGITLHWDDEAIKSYQGDCLMIYDDTRYENGVWLDARCVIDESEYKIDGEVDETKRNELIERYMEKTGYFPGVFHCDRHGNVFFVNTKAK